MTQQVEQPRQVSAEIGATPATRTVLGLDLHQFGIIYSLAVTSQNMLANIQSLEMEKVFDEHINLLQDNPDEAKKLVVALTTLVGKVAEYSLFAGGLLEQVDKLLNPIEKDLPIEE